MKISVERKVTIWFVLALCLSLFFTYLTFKSKIDYVERGTWVKLSYNIQAELQNINAFMQEMEILSHDYMISGNENLIKSYNTSLDSLNKSIEHFRQLTKDNPRHQELIKVLKRLNEEKLKEYQHSFYDKSMRDKFQVITDLSRNNSKTLIDSLRIVINKMDYEEDLRLDERMLSQQNASQKAVSSLIVMVALFLLMVGIFYWLILDDIKKRKKAEVKLAENEAFLNMIFNESIDALFLVDKKTNLIEKCNKAAVKMFGVNNEQELLKTFGPRFHKNPFSQSELNEINYTIEKEGVWKSELIYKTNSGKEFWGAVSMNAFDFNSRSHKLIRIIDITDKKNSEQALTSYAGALEESRSRLQGLTSELLVKNNELKKSELALRELNASKDKFFSILAHDMRSPFTGLLGIAEYLSECNDMIPRSEMKELSVAVYLSAKKVYGLLNNLLEWSRLQMGKIEYLPSAAKLTELAEEAVDIQLQNAEAKDICLSNEVKSEISVFADQNMVSTILRNLLSNAIKFTNSGGEVSLTAVEKDQYAEICVKDTGIGMTKDIMEKIFRIDSKLTTKGTQGEEGTGLGLILCKELIEKNRGEFRVESHPGKGTVFTFTLPLLPKGETGEIKSSN
ncbi:MAG TPA: ATP-binding protein [Ignavibacteriales bacterium]|nr:ATP-binding protein [Ignavibacteriales bacterium]